jgi:hypothetical protein
MSNNKLYTEADLKKVISIYSEEYKTSTDEILKELNLTPHFQYLPTDEEICVQFENYSENWEVRHALQVGAKWMRDKIGGNND